MNFYAAIKEYENADINSKLEGCTKHDFIKIVLEELTKNLKSLKYSIENEGKLSKTKQCTSMSSFQSLLCFSISSTQCLTLETSWKVILSSIIACFAKGQGGKLPKSG